MLMVRFYDPVTRTAYNLNFHPGEDYICRDGTITVIRNNYYRHICPADVITWYWRAVDPPPNRDKVRAN